MKIKSENSLETSLTQQNFTSSTSFYLKNSIREAKRRKLYFCLALTSTLIVVAATAVSQTVLDYAPLIFMKSAQSKTGAIDVSIVPLKATYVENDGVTSRTVTKNMLLNSTAIEAQVDPVYSGVTTARYSLTSSFKTLKGSACRSTTSTPYQSCPSYGVTFVLQNTLKEEEMGMSTNIKWSAIPSGGIVITKKFAQITQVNSGDNIIIRADVTSLLQEVAIQFNSKQGGLTNKMISTTKFTNNIAYIPYKIVGIVDDMDGKFPDGSYDFVIVEYEHFFTMLGSNMPSTSPTSNVNYAAYLRYLKAENPRNYASEIDFNLKNRLDVYRDSNFDNIQDQLTTFSSKISDTLGVFPFSMGLPVYKELSNLKYGALFLGLALNIIIVVLFILSTILIYNILLVTVETKVFEFGVIRMIGLNKHGIAQLILVQALMFVLPGVVLGLVLSSPLLVGVGSTLGNTLSIDIPVIPSETALFWSIFMGMAIPLISSYYPMKEALGKNLNLSLDLAHSKTSAVQITIETGATKFPWPEVTFGIISVVFGVAVHIILPLSLLSYDLGLLLGMFFVILLGLLVGLTLLSLNFQHFMETFVTEIFLFWTSTSFRSLVKKNLVAHKLRNRQAATMYSLALGFILFILVSLNQQLDNMAYQDQADRGALFELKTDSSMDYEILEDAIDTYLSDVVESYAFISHDLAAYTELGGVQSVEITHQGQLYTFTPNILAVSPTIFQTTQNDFLVVNQADKNTGLDLGEQLYTPRGSQGVIIGEAIRDQLGLTLDEDSSLIIKLYNGSYTWTEELRILASVDSAPGFTFSKYPSVTDQDILVSIPTYTRLASMYATGVADIAINRMLIKVKGDSSTNLAKVSSVMSQIKQTQYASLKIWDYSDTEKSTENNKSALSFIFKAVEVLVMILSMFSLVTSMSTNILEQTKEIAVLRAVGLTQLKVNLIYVCEAFVLILSSAIFGIIIGTFVAYILTLQSVLFTGLPMMFSFPFIDIAIIFVTAIISAFLSSYFPATRVTRLQISKIIRLGA